MRVVITGGAGFLGSHLCRSFLERGDEVVAVDNLCTGLRENIAELEGQPGFELVLADVSREIPVSGRVDGVLHFASPASPPEYLEMPLETMDVGSLGTRNALDLARGERRALPRRVDQRDLRRPARAPADRGLQRQRRPHRPACGVRRSEALRRDADDDVPPAVRASTPAIVRIFNTYGPRLRPADGRVVSNFLAQAAEGKPLTIYGDGSQTRSFCYVDDEVRGLVALFDSDVVDPVNIGNPDEYTMLELADLVREVTDSIVRARVRAVADRRSDPAPARHHPRARAARLGAGDRAARGPRAACTTGTRRNAPVAERDSAPRRSCASSRSSCRCSTSATPWSRSCGACARRAARHHRARDPRRRRRQRRRHP